MVPSNGTGWGSVGHDFERLAAAIVEARKAKGWGQDDLIRESGLGRSTIQRLEAARQKTVPNKATVQSLERALGWLPGSVEVVLGGGMPAEGSYDGKFLRVRIDNESEFVRDLVRKITFEVDADAPLSRIVAAEAVAEAALREHGLLPPLDDQASDETNSNE
jgi:transcriptional regulator with XRE-family HTH domain